MTLTTEKPVMLKCGCAAHAVCNARGGIKYDPPIPSCVVHDCIEQVETPSFEGRQAQCSCGKLEPSSMRLAFFEFRGDGSPDATDKCKCGALSHLHLPYWEAKIKIVRRWYKTERSESGRTEGIHAPDEETAKLMAAAHVEKWRNWGPHSEETKIYNVELVSLTSMRRPRYHFKVCSTFVPAGANKYDRYYCGHSGWN